MVELGTSNVSLKKEDITQRKKEFEQTYFEFLSREGVQIKIGSQTSTSPIYTVPTNKLFYLFAMNFQCEINVESGTPNGWRFQDSGTGAVQEICGVNGNILNQIQHNNLFPAIPIRFEEGTTFALQIGANVSGIGFMFGIEVDKEIAFRR